VPQSLDKAVLQEIVHHVFQFAAVGQFVAQVPERNAPANAEQNLAKPGPQGVTQIEDFILPFVGAAQLHVHFHGRLLESEQDFSCNPRLA
jgi:hypothetical protein